jgi:hypothetical protein
MREHEPYTNKYCAIDALLKSLDTNTALSQKFTNEFDNLYDPHTAILELASLLQVMRANMSMLAKTILSYAIMGLYKIS